MITNKYVTTIISVLMAAAVIICILASVNVDIVTAAVSDGEGVTMEYETKLFDTSEIMSVNIIMDNDDWSEMLENAMSEEYYSCDVEINGTTFKNVGIRPKGNTSLSSIANDPDTDRYGFKLEFDHYVEGQTCFGLDKLILNNNYSDATMMKEALIYDMFQYVGADASLYNFAKVSVNGDYWGVYLALEAVEDSFLVRNYGVQDGELYKPEGMDMGGNGGPNADGNDGNHDGNPFENDGNKPDFDGNKPGDDGDDGTNFEERPNNNDSDSEETTIDEEENIIDMPDFGKKHDAQGTDNKSESADSDSVMGDISILENTDQNQPELSNMENGGSNTENNDLESAAKNNVPENSKISPQNGVNQFDDNCFDKDEKHGPGGRFGGTDGPDGGAPRGFRNGQNGANLNYSDDDLNSYSTIWDGEVTKTTDSDHERVVTALKNISEGINLEDYMDIDNLLKYAAVHIFSVNDDSLSGAMAHNYYLYELNGKLNLIPWDYNLAFGGMNGTDASGVVNSPIDDAFSSTDFFDTLMANEEYHDQYYAYLEWLVEEYINNGGFDAFYNRVRSQIDDLVKDDPTAFYTYGEYNEAAEMLYKTVKLRGESILGQINGTIPSAEEEQKDSDVLIDASDIDISVMGQMHNEGNDNGGPEGGTSDRPDKGTIKNDSDNVDP